MNKPRRVKFIESLNIREVMAYDAVEYHKFVSPDTAVVSYEDQIIELGVEMSLNVVPVHTFRRTTRDTNPPYEYHSEDTYIAYSKEVEELLHIPINSYESQLKTANEGSLMWQMNSNKVTDKLGSMAQMSFIDRLQFLLIGSRFGRAFTKRHA